MPLRPYVLTPREVTVGRERIAQSGRPILCTVSHEGVEFKTNVISFTKVRGEQRWLALEMNSGSAFTLVKIWY